MRFLPLLLVLSALPACKPARRGQQFGSGNLVQAVTEMSAALKLGQQVPTYTPTINHTLEQKLSSFTASLVAAMTDDLFSFDGQAYGGLKGAIANHQSVVATPTAADRVFASLAELFAAFGLDQKISQEDLDAYAKTAPVALRELFSGQAASPEVELPTLVKALHAATALSSIAIDKNATLGATGGPLDYCTAAPTSAGASRSWLCHKDTVSGAIAYLAANHPKLWQDALTKTVFDDCPPGSRTGAGGWGWIPDAPAKKGRTCRVKAAPAKTK